jgi:S-adenosyl-L-methionine hydrolase (adenosine-forming)
VSHVQSLVTLTTDFGAGSFYVAAMKGVLLSGAPEARLIDLSHTIPPQDLRFTAFFLARCLPYFPTGSIHVVVVDPGVGTDRSILHIEAEGRHLIAPDNGCWCLAVEQWTDRPQVRRLTESTLWQPTVSATFHGRDIFAPVAVYLARGGAPEALGSPVTGWIRLALPAPTLGPDRLTGEVVFVDPFGNLLTNIPGEAFLAMTARDGRVRIGGTEVARVVRTYGEAEPGAVVALVSSSGCLEVAVTQGNAARTLAAGIGTAVEVVPLPARP